MRNIAIIGAGQSGLQLGVSLLKAGYQVTLYNDRSAEQIANGHVVSSPALFESSLNNERALGMHLWEDSCPKNTAITFSMGNKDKLLLNWQGKTKHVFQAIDPRIKMPAWIELFEVLGGNFIIEDIDGLQQLDNLAAQFELVIVATGKSSLSQLFEVDPDKSIFDEPQRTLALFYVNNVQPDEFSGVRFSAVPGVGEFFTMPGLTKSGPCEMMLFEGLLNSPFDCWKETSTPDAQLAKAKELLETYLPWEASRFAFSKLTDNKATFMGSYTPLVRHSILQLPSGRTIFGMGDAIVLNDPISGQGANSASKCASIYSSCIQERAAKAFDVSWMQETFNQYWAYAKWITRWTNILLQVPKPHFICLMQAASVNQDLANYLAGLFEYPPYFFPWIENEVETQKMIKGFCHSQFSTEIFKNIFMPSVIERCGLESILVMNEKYASDYEKNNLLIRFLKSEEATQAVFRNQLLDAIQVFSDYFQKIVMLRRVLTENSSVINVAQVHLEEEFNHNYKLLKDRKGQPSPWDATLESAASWFTWKMFTLNDSGKTLLVHFVLESSANIFFSKADKLMSHYNETEYFSDHACLDEKHERMGIQLLEGLSHKEYEELMTVQEQGWSVLNLICNRIVEMALKSVPTKFTSVSPVVENSE